MEIINMLHWFAGKQIRNVAVSINCFLIIDILGLCHLECE